MVVLLVLGTVGFGIAALVTRIWEHPPLSRERLRLLLPVVACSVLAAVLSGVQALALED